MNLVRLDVQQLVGSWSKGGRSCTAAPRSFFYRAARLNIRLQRGNLKYSTGCVRLN